MKMTLCIAGALGALVLPSTAAASGHTPSPKQVAQAACKSERAEVGKAEYRRAYGAANKNRTNAHRNCVKRMTAVARSERAGAQQDCRNERGETQESRQAFREEYGTNRNQRNAFGKCVSGKTEDAVAEIVAARVAAFATCKSERGTTPESRRAFRDRHGTNRNKRNAFGKCVSKAAKAQQDNGEQETEQQAAAA